MATFCIRERMTTYAVVYVEAESQERAMEIYNNAEDDLDWGYDTDYDSAKFLDIEQVED